MKKETFCKIITSLKILSDFENKALDLDIDILPSKISREVHSIVDTCFEACFGKLPTFNLDGEEHSVDNILDIWLYKFNDYSGYDDLKGFSIEELYDLCIKEYKTCKK